MNIDQSKGPKHLSIASYESSRDTCTVPSQEGNHMHLYQFELTRETINSNDHSGDGKSYTQLAACHSLMLLIA